MFTNFDPKTEEEKAEKRAALAQGEADYAAGATLNDNPYPGGYGCFKWRAWERSWIKCAEEFRKKVEAESQARIQELLNS